MSIEIKVPQLPESVEDATVGAWHKKPGEAVSRDENLVDLETDKVVLEVPSPEAGVLGEIRVQEGEVVGAGDVLGLVEEGQTAEASGGAAQAAEGASETAGQPEPAAAGEATEPATEATDEAAPGSAPASAPGPMSPAVRRLVEDHDLDPSRIRGTGKGGRLTKADVLEYMEKAEDAGKAEASAAPAAQAPEASAPAPSAPEPPAKDEDSSAAAAPPAGAGTEGRSEQRVPMTRMRARIAERLVEAQQTAAMLTTFNEVDLKAVKELRQRYRESFEREHGVRLGYMSFFVKACVEALKRFPVVNASIDGKDIIYHGYFDIGIAVASPRGLVVPILRDADQMSYAEIEKTISEFGQKAEDGKLTLDELTGGTFSITNGGVFGSLVSTPILNPPQTAILGMHKIEDRPVVRDGEIVIRPMMYLALSYDHRLVDGKEAVQFLVAVKEMLEDPARLLLQV